MAGGDAKKSNASGGGKKKEVKKETGLGLANRKDENFGEWYSEVVVNGEMIEYYDISGCYILRPWAMAIWEIMQTFLTYSETSTMHNRKGDGPWCHHNSYTYNIYPQ